jgi:hypothetical protein
MKKEFTSMLILTGRELLTGNIVGAGQPIAKYMACKHCGRMIHSTVDIGRREKMLFVHTSEREK